MSREFFIPVTVGDKIYNARIHFVNGACGTIELSIEKKHIGHLCVREGEWCLLTRNNCTTLTSDDIQILGRIIEDYLDDYFALKQEYSKTIDKSLPWPPPPSRPLVIKSYPFNNLPE